MSLDDISATQTDFVKAAENALYAGCDGVEIHAGNGYVEHVSEVTGADNQVPI